MEAWDLGKMRAKTPGSGLRQVACARSSRGLPDARVMKECYQKPVNRDAAFSIEVEPKQEALIPSWRGKRYVIEYGTLLHFAIYREKHNSQFDHFIVRRSRSQLPAFRSVKASIREIETYLVNIIVKLLESSKTLLSWVAHSCQSFQNRIIVLCTF